MESRTYPELGAVTQPTAGWEVRPSCLRVPGGAGGAGGEEEPQPAGTNINQRSLARAQSTLGVSRFLIIVLMEAIFLSCFQ